MDVFSTISNIRRWSACCPVFSKKRWRAAGVPSCRQAARIAWRRSIWRFGLTPTTAFCRTGLRGPGYASEQPVYLTLGHETPNGAGVRFLVDGAEAQAFSGAERFVYVFDGRDPDAVASARAQWKGAKAAGCAVTYWQQSESGRWEKKA